MSAEAEPKINPLLWHAIEQSRLIRLVCKSTERIVEPHDYGIHSGVVKLFAYQLGGSAAISFPPCDGSRRNRSLLSTDKEQR